MTKHGIHYYEKMFSTPYPFDKFDQVFCPDYRCGAMENVGLVTYNDLYVTRGEKFTRDKTENIYNTILHEISHMWFGNLVTMKWWDDLWLNESFANFISYNCMQKAEGLEDITLAWSIFLGQQNWALKTDVLNSSHPIAAFCESTGDAEDIFDGISYGKGASWLKQMHYMYGEDTLKEGLKTYFSKYAFKNTELQDFVTELAIAAKKTGVVKDEKEMLDWSATWLQTAGAAEIKLTHESENDKLKSVKMHQTPFNKENIKENRLRKQKIAVALLNKEMKVIKKIDQFTSETESEQVIAELQGQQTPHAFLINYEAHGYAKFIIDEMSLKAFETDLWKIEDKLTRK